MPLWFWIGVSCISMGALAAACLRAWIVNSAPDKVVIPERIWEELKSSIPESDYIFLRSTKDYMGETPSDLIARLTYIGAAHNPSDPKQIRISILELRLADLEKAAEQVAARMPTDVHIIWLAVSSVATVSSISALIFYLLDRP